MDSVFGLRVLNSPAVCKHQAGKVLVSAGDGLHGAIPELLVRVGLDKSYHCSHYPWAEPMLLQRLFDEQVSKILKRSSTGCIHRAVCEYHPLYLIQESYTIQRVTLAEAVPASSAMGGMVASSRPYSSSASAWRRRAWLMSRCCAAAVAR